MKRISLLSVLLIFSVSFFSCVSSKKYKASQEQYKQLEAQNAELNNQIGTLKKQVEDLTNRNKAVMTEYSNYQASCQDCQQKLAAVRASLNETVSTMEEVLAKLNAAMENFQSKGVDLYERDGNIYVSMSEGLLYSSGSAKLGDAGKQALGSLASVLNEYPKLQVLVVGNTDAVKVKGVADNWSLSTERANGVVRVLTGTYDVDPARLTAAGHGKFDPIADNSTAEGRAKNRRTDIILNPDMERIWRETKAEKK